MTMRTPSRRLTAHFKNNTAAEHAQKSVSFTLCNAEKDVAALFKRQDGIADSCDVSNIYARYGFRNDCGWQQLTPLFVEDATLYWEIPEGMVVEEAEQLLLALGAVSARREDLVDENLLRNVPHPAALFLSEIEEMQDFEDDDAFWTEDCEKKTIH